MNMVQHFRDWETTPQCVKKGRMNWCILEGDKNSTYLHVKVPTVFLTHGFEHGLNMFEHSLDRFGLWFLTHCDFSWPVFESGTQICILYRNIHSHTYTVHFFLKIDQTTLPILVIFRQTSRHGPWFPIGMWEGLHVPKSKHCLCSYKRWPYPLGLFGVYVPNPLRNEKSMVC